MSLSRFWSKSGLISESELLFILLSKVQEITYKNYETLICLFLGGLLGLDRNICRRWERKTKTRKVIGWRYPQSLYPGNAVPTLCPQLFRHNVPMGATALDREGFSPEQICHETGQEWRVYPRSKSRKLKASVNEHLLYAKHFPMSSFIVLSSELHSKKNGFLASWGGVGSSHLLPKMIHACQRVWKPSLREQVRTGWEPGHCFSLRLWGQGVGMGKEKDQFILAGSQTGFQGGGKYIPPRTVTQISRGLC